MVDPSAGLAVPVEWVADPGTRVCRPRRVDLALAPTVLESCLTPMLGVWQLCHSPAPAKVTWA